MFTSYIKFYSMTRSRLEAFSDGFFSIIITIMVLEIKIPKETNLHALLGLYPVFISYVMSFIFIGIYWGNHHHLLHTVDHINSNIIWANMALLFTLSLILFSTGWMGENHFDKLPVAVYAINLLLCAINFYVLQYVIMSSHERDTHLTEALKKQEKKGVVSLVSYSIAVLFAFFFPIASAILIAFVTIIWLIPDKDIEKALMED
jgi:uncharacterized membrane protein